MLLRNLKLQGLIPAGQGEPLDPEYSGINSGVATQLLPQASGRTFRIDLGIQKLRAEAEMEIIFLGRSRNCNS